MQCNAIWGPFDLDVAASKDNALCKMYFDGSSDEFDGLQQKWFGKCWMNPPYGSSELKEWCTKVEHEVYATDHAILVCALLPAKTEQLWWRFVERAQYVQFISGRLTFGGAKTGAQFPSVIAVWHRRIIR